MLDKEINNLLQEYKYKRRVWDNKEITWDSILSKPTTLQGYGITDVYTKEEVEDNFLKLVDGYVDGNLNIDSSSNIRGIMFHGSSSNYASIFGDEEFLSLSVQGGSDLSINKKIILTSQGINGGVVLYNATKLLGGVENNYKELLQYDSSTNRIILGDYFIPTQVRKALELPKIDIYNNNNILGGSIEWDSYTVDNVAHDGFKIMHKDGKYALWGYEKNNIINSYMILDIDGVLRKKSDGNDWAPIRFEKQALFRNGLRIGSLGDINIGGYSLTDKIANLESAITEGTGMVKWTNVLNKPGTLSGYGITDALPLSGGTITGELSLMKGKSVWMSGFSSGSKSGYILIGTIKITNAYQNAPMTIQLSSRGRRSSMYLSITFANANSVDPALQNFHYYGENYGAYLVKSATSTWDLYITKSEAYDYITVVDFNVPRNILSGVTMMWKDDWTSTVPTGLSQTKAVLCFYASNLSLAKGQYACAYEESNNYNLIGMGANYGETEVGNEEKQTVIRANTGIFLSRKGIITHYAFMGASLDSGEALYGSIKAGATDYSSYVRVGPNSLKYNNGTSAFDIFHEGNTQKILPAFNSNSTTVGVDTTKLLYTAPIASGNYGLFPTTSNANSILELGLHPRDIGSYTGQLGFSGNGRMYYRYYHSEDPINNQNKPWNTIAFTTDSSNGLQLKTTSSSSSSDKNKWTKIASVSISYQYGQSDICFIIQSYGEMTNSVLFGLVIAKIKQQNKMGRTPNVAISMPISKNFSVSDVVGVITENSTSNSKLDIYVKYLYNWMNYNITKINGNGAFETYTNQSNVDELPSGAQVKLS